MILPGMLLFGSIPDGSITKNFCTVNIGYVENLMKSYALTGNPSPAQAELNIFDKYLEQVCGLSQAIRRRISSRSIQECLLRSFGVNCSMSSFTVAIRTFFSMIFAIITTVFRLYHTNKLPYMNVCPPLRQIPVDFSGFWT